MTDKFTNKPVLAWHFQREDLRGGGYDEPEERWRKGTKRTIDGQISMCRKGYHACENIIDALSYLLHPVITRVELTGERIIEGDKICAKTKKLLWYIPAKDSRRILQEFACDCAWRALMHEKKVGRKPDQRSIDAVKAARAFLRGEISQGEMEVAASAAESAAWSARSARSAAWSARSAAWSAASAESAAWSARSARSAAWSVASAASAERKWQESRLLKYIKDYMGDSYE